MAEPIANDWKAIHDRMQQIAAERSASLRPCPQCNGQGWIPDFLSAQHATAVRFGVCDQCYNPEKSTSARPPAPRQPWSRPLTGRNSSLREAKDRACHALGASFKIAAAVPPRA